MAILRPRLNDHSALLGDDLHIARAFSAAATPEGDLAPTVLGELFLNSANNELFIATGPANTDWVLVAGDATFLEATDLFVTSSLADILLASIGGDDFTLTPAAGTYLVFVSSVAFASAAAVNANLSIYVGGVQIASTRRRTTTTAPASLTTFARVVVNGSQAIEARVSRTGGGGGTTVSYQERGLIIKRIR